MNDFWDGDPFSDGGCADAQDDALLAPLNEAQRAAVLHGQGPLLVLAGAGSGKTRVITHRVAHLALRRNVAPWRILAVTFTNKAAGEMRSRLFQLLGPMAASCQVSTFHSLCATILRREAERVGLTSSFVIYDDGDSMQLLRRALKDLGLEEELKPQQVRYRIDQAKNEGKRPNDIATSQLNRMSMHLRDVYARYEALLRAANAVDFGSLLLELVDLLRRDSEVLDFYRRRFEYVLVDEFQDTNPIQYALIRLLCPPGHDNLCAVGDDDQSIYRWRGADPTNILSFEKHFPGAAVVKLEQNYRSDGAI
ncbi:MAG: UvrD-helicase domain-containing protein, partial [Myxococcaceae bacterium]|nr:UvrD-helicase domain-containing protein [Myxococcaceae bacterium]